LRFATLFHDDMHHHGRVVAKHVLRHARKPYRTFFKSEAFQTFKNIQKLKIPFLEIPKTSTMMRCGETKVMPRTVLMCSGHCQQAEEGITRKVVNDVAL
jgi:hypothetical protein